MTIKVIFAFSFLDASQDLRGGKKEQALEVFSRLDKCRVCRYHPPASPQKLPLALICCTMLEGDRAEFVITARCHL